MPGDGGCGARGERRLGEVPGSRLDGRDTTSIGRANLDGSGVDSQFITVPGGRLSGVALDSSFVYWTDLRGTVERANLDGTGITQSFVAEAGKASGVAVDGRYIYWTQIFGTRLAGRMAGPSGGPISTERARIRASLRTRFCRGE
jgi:hypothetical protein